MIRILFPLLVVTAALVAVACTSGKSNSNNGTSGGTAGGSVVPNGSPELGRENEDTQYVEYVYVGGERYPVRQFVIEDGDEPYNFLQTMNIEKTEIQKKEEEWKSRRQRKN